MRNDYSEYLQKSRQVYYNRLLIIVAAFLILSINNLYAQCPANFNFNYNNLSYWTINLQLYNGATVPNTNVTTFNAPPASIQSLQSYLDQSGGQNAVQIFANTGSSQSTDPIAPTIKTVPNINGYQYDYAVKLGNTTTGRLVRKISYLINVPTGVTAYNVTYAYALVLQDPGHAWDAQPRFTATVRDPEKPAGQDTIKCASVSYFVPASAADKAAQGFFLTSSGAYAKDWSEASLDIAGWSGKTIIIEFESDDCSAGGHYGYAYFAIRNDGCGAGSVTGNSIICGNNGTYLYSTPPILGASYNWTLPSGWTGTSTTNAITVTPSSNGGYITVTPTKSCGSVQTRSLNVTVATSVPAAPGTISGPASICNNSSNLTYTVNRVSNASSYAWTIPPGWTIVNGGTDTTVTVNATTSGGSISVVAKNGCGSSNPSASTLSIINSPASVGGTTTGGTSVCAGTNVSLSSSGYTGTIQSWQNSTDGGLTWNDIAATSTSYTANNPTTSALYRIKVQNGSCPPAYSTPTTLSVNAPPAIMFNPTSVGACTGGTVNFSVTATGAGLSYQWQRSTDGNNWVNITGSGTPADGITYSNYTTNQLTLANVPIGANNYQYRCVVSGTCSPQAISTAATISISGASATISTQPTGITLCQGSTTTLSMSAVGSNLTYQWYTNTNNANTGGTAISGATQKDITFSASSSGTTYYYCVATSTCGANSVTAATNAVPVVVNTSNTVSVSFSANPGNTICANTPVTFTANPINGGTSPSFVWTKNNVVVGTSAATYIDSSLNNADVIGLTLNSNVSCAIGNPASAAPAIITVNPLPAVANITGPNTVQKGNTITLNNSTNGGTWSSSNNSIATVNSSGLVTGVAEGNVTITYTYNNGTCTNSSSLNITVTEVPPSALSYTTPNVYTVGSTISSLNPTYSGGIVTDFGISPALPAGLSFNSTTGVISGTPTAISAATNYTITATNSGGSTTAIVNITVNDVAPSGLSYTTPNVYTVGTAITPLTPSVSGGAVTSYSISGTLPAGLNFNTTTGVISGTPTAISAATNYTITATNSGGSTTAIVNITVNDVAPSGLSYTTPNVYTVGTAITPLTPSV
ncbi:putative Ig domain-containing protein, partial [Hydrotalea sandarakina]